MLDEDGIRKHLELLCKCFISQKLHHNDFRAKSNYSLVNKELYTIDLMVLTIKTYHPGLFLKNLQYKDYPSNNSCCDNPLLCTLWKAMFCGVKLNWFILAASLELFYITLPIMANESLNYGEISAYAAGYVESMCAHSKIVQFVTEQDGWVALSNYFDNHLAEGITEKKPVSQEPTVKKIGYCSETFAETFRPQANKIFISILVVAMAIFIKVSFTNGHENLVDSFKMLNKFN